MPVLNALTNVVSEQVQSPALATATECRPLCSQENPRVVKLVYRSEQHSGICVVLDIV